MKSFLIILLFSSCSFMLGQSVNIQTDEQGKYYDSNSQIDSTKYYWKKYTYWKGGNIDSANKYFELLKNKYGKDTNTKTYRYRES